jgi:hypothetical protein
MEVHIMWFHPSDHIHLIEQSHCLNIKAITLVHWLSSLVYIKTWFFSSPETSFVRTTQKGERCTRCTLLIYRSMEIFEKGRKGIKLLFKCAPILRGSVDNFLVLG